MPKAGVSLWTILSEGGCIVPQVMRNSTCGWNAVLLIGMQVNQSGVVEMAKTSPCRHEELSLNPRTPIKSWMRCLCAISALER